MKTYTTYVMVKKDDKYIITRYLLDGSGKLLERFWINTYYKEKDADNHFNIIKEWIKYYNKEIIVNVRFDNVWELQYVNY